MEFISIVTPEKIDFILLDDLLFCKADRKLTHFYDIHQNKYTSSKRMGEYEAVLLANGFFRIHHGYIINLKYLKSILSKKTPFVELAADFVLPISKRKYVGFIQHLGIKRISKNKSVGN